jgi:RNA polymerase-binding transcription factor DksA
MDIQTYKNGLEKELDVITDELTGIAQYNDSTADWEAKPAASNETSDPNMTADNAEDSVERQGTVASLETRFRNLKRALQKIEGGTFGTCEICSDIIEEERLIANPAARTCIAHREQESELPL